MRVLRLCPPSSLLQGLVALLAICIQPPTLGWNQQGHTEEDVFLLPINSSSRSLANLGFDLQTEKSTTVESVQELKATQTGHTKSLPSPSSSPLPPVSSSSSTWDNSKDTLIVSPQTHREVHASQSQQQVSTHCNISVHRLMLTSLLVRWGRQLGFQCDLLLFSTNNHGRAFFSAAYNRVVSPVIIEHLGVSGAQQEFRLCVGCGWSRSRRSGHLRHQHASSSASSTFSFLSSSSTDPHNPLPGETLNFCCLDFTLEELRGEQGWRMNRKPIESTLVACFMTLVIIVWSVAALIWPVPIIAGFLPNESYTISLQPTDNITIHIKPSTNTPSPPCNICTPKCTKSSLEISRGNTVDYTFSCKTPELYFIMEISRTIDCSSGMCPLNISLQPTNLQGLNQTFIWNILTSKNNGLIFGFSSQGLTQIDPSSRCPDHVSFKISTYVHGSSYSIGTFCRNGTITRIKVQEKGVIVLSLPWNVNIKDPGMSIANRSSIKSLSIVESTFREQSTVTLLSANYPDPFPTNEQMTWKFSLPEKHAAAVHFLNHTLPVCVKKEENVHYYLPSPALYKLTDNQPANIFQNFNLTLQNCEVDMQKTGHPGLSLKFNITVQKNQPGIFYALDLTKEKGLVVRITKRFIGRGFTPVCLICKEFAKCEPELVLEGGRYYKISFLCEQWSSLMVTAEKVIECWDLKTCNISHMPLTIPQTVIDFPIQLESYSWKLIAPENISNEIVSKSVYLQQDVVDKPCYASAVGFTYDIFSSTNKETFKIGTFCPNGSIQKIQLRDNVTITLKTPKNGNPQKLQTHDLHVSFVSFIKEESIFTVSPKTEEAIHLETPNYEYGLPDYASASWSINITEKQTARLKFGKDKMDISCEMGRAYVNIKEQKDGSPETVRREDQQLPSQLDIYSTFWVNISNCKPLKGTKKLKLQFSITFNQISPGEIKPSRPVLKYILIAAASAVGVVLAVIATICCIKNKKKQIKAPVGIYNSKVNLEAPRRQAFFKKGRKDNESHIYAVIDDHMVYGHLLQEETNEMVPEVDVYQPFEGPMGNAPPIPPINFPNGSTRVDVKDEIIKEDLEDGSLDRAIMDEPRSLSMKDNDLYVFSQSFSKQPVENEDTSITYMDDTRSGATSPV